MEHKTAQYVIQGMQRDLSFSKHNPNYAYECHNIRITAVNGDTLLSVTNERGTREMSLVTEKMVTFTIPDYLEYVGHCVVGDYLVLFLGGRNYNTGYSEEAIYRIHVKSDPPPVVWVCKVLWYAYENRSSDFLGITPIYPIQAYGQYESLDVIKVYWIDGIHQPRMLNIMKEITQEYPYAFDFCPVMNPLQVDIATEVLSSSIGEFKSGVVQYYITLFNRFGLQSNIVATSELVYLSESQRGGAPEENISNSVKLTITTKNRQFGFLRIYSTYWPEQGTPQVKIVGDYSIDIWVSNPIQTIVDTNSTGETIDPYELLYINREPLIAKAMAEKDNTKFFGNLERMLPTITNDREMSGGIIIGEGLLDEIKKASVTWVAGYVPYKSARLGGYYVYEHQLKYGQSRCTVFKYLEWYILGVQFQHTTGAWSDPIYLGRFQNTNPPRFSEADVVNITVYKPHITLTGEAKNRLIEKGYVRARAMVVYPEGTQRSVIAQGILCPTVFNYLDRFTNTPFVQSSWISRPDLPFDIDANLANLTEFTNGDYSGDIQNSVAGTVVNGQQIWGSYAPYGAYPEFRSYQGLPMNWSDNAEIQCLAGNPPSIWDTGLGGPAGVSERVGNSQEYYLVDKSILTMHSPEFEFGEITNTLSNVKLRIIGYSRVSANASDMDIQTSTGPFSTENVAGYQKYLVGVQNRSQMGGRALLSTSNWFDTPYNTTNSYKGAINMRGFRIYMWHRNGSLNNQGVPVGDEQRTAVLKTKTISNMRFSDMNFYSAEEGLPIWEPPAGIQDVNIFSAEGSPMLRIKGPAGTDDGELNYYGIVDKVLSPTFTDYSYTYVSTASPFNKVDGYPIVASGNNMNSTKVLSFYQTFSTKPTPLRGMGVTPSTTVMGTDPVSIKYKSGTHGVIVLNAIRGETSTRYDRVILPTHWSANANGTTGAANLRVVNNNSRIFEFWNKRLKEGGKGNGHVAQDIIGFTSTTSKHNFPHFWLAELYRDDITVDTSEQAIQSYKWIPAGQPIVLSQTTQMDAIYGDTYLQRYDSLRTYPYSEEDPNKVVDIVSFYCETRINIDGRYDKNRGQASNLYITPSIFNKLNKVYSVKNGMFTYRILDNKKFTNREFPSSIVISKEHTLLEDIDQSTLINISSTYTCDTNKGDISCITKLGNELYCFQEHATSNILFNSRIQVPTSDSVPIEITNGMKLSGVRYISNTIGVFNKWSVIATHSAIYTIDDYTSSIYMFNGQQYTSLSDKLGFKHWLGENRHTRGGVTEKWAPAGFHNYVSFYDETNGDVYFINRDTALVYSEQLGQFTSFMDYGGVPAIFSFNKYLMSFRERKLWAHFKGEYNMFYGTYKPYSVTIVANPEEPLDKIFNVIEFRANESRVTIDESNLEYPISELIDKPEGPIFDNISVENNYQYGTGALISDRNSYFPYLRRKFRIWRATIPRANALKNGEFPSYSSRDRMRSPWVTIKLERSRSDENTAIELHDMIVHYSI